ncbi:GTPase [Nakamurella lactea]|uniref:GTPase n=1 Tax=Nakamurella lactea TaxID=459515 RepID=UPI000417CE45|nr:GTPase [Nakamurella lactea]
MNIFGRGRSGKRRGGPDLAARVTALQQVLQVGGPRLGEVSARRADELIGKLSQRLTLAGDNTVAALAGATGSGKSSLFNAICGSAVSQVGVRRPTTSTATAAIWEADPEAAEPSALLNWLAVPRRQLIAATGQQASLDKLVLLDLPDHDSTETAHRAESDRLIELVDVFVWVTDPQKYADAALHRRYLSRLAGHDAVTIVVLNQADRLTPEQLRAAAADLTRLLRADGLDAVQVLPTSVVTGQGIETLRGALAQAVGRRSAAAERLSADLDAVAVELSADIGTGEIDPATVHRDGGLAAAMAAAAGVPTVLAAVEAGYRRDASGAVGWPFTRWLRRFRPDPLRRLRIGRAGGRADAADTVARTSLPPPTPAALTQLDLATRRLGDAASAGLPPRWAAAVEDAARPPQVDLADGLDRVVGEADLGMRKPAWWRVIGAIQWLLAAAATAGLVWLLVLAVLGWLHVPPPNTPYLGPLPWPTLLLLGGAVVGLALALLLRPAIAVGARRRRDRVAALLDRGLASLAEQRILQPVQRVLAEHRETRRALEAVRSGR